MTNTDTTTKSLSDMTPVEIDTELARIWKKIDAAHRDLWSYKKDRTKKFTWGKAAGQLMYPEGSERRAVLEAQIAKLEERVAEIQTEADPFEAEYRARPWLRYFLVTNSNGHVHRGMDCRTCFYDTQYNWLVDLADCDEAQMITDYGELACTVCFPDAPTNPAFARPGRLAREEKAAKQAEKDAKLAAKMAKLLDEPVETTYDHTVRTVAAAKQGIRDSITYTRWYGDKDGKRAADRDLLVAALLRKGITQSEIDTIIERARKAAK